MKEIKVQAPAKINITLDVVNRRDDGFHDLESIMHAISLYDFLTFKLEDSQGISIELSGNSDEIPYDESNLIWKAAKKFFDATKIENAKLSVYVEKNIPVKAGLAGGSTDAAATLFALNKLYDNILDNAKINEICASLGSDLNFCLKGGCAICTSRGEEIRPIPFIEKPVSIVKPRYMGISAKEAFQEYDFQDNPECVYSTRKLVPIIVRGGFDESLMHNDLEIPLRKKYNHINNMRKNLKNSLISGSGPICYAFTKEFEVLFDPDEFICIQNLRTIGDGVKVVE